MGESVNYRLACRVTVLPLQNQRMTGLGVQAIMTGGETMVDYNN